MSNTDATFHHAVLRVIPNAWMRTMWTILLNQAACLRCGEVLESIHRHDFKSCTCGAIAVDGGRDYMKRGYKKQEDFLEMSITIQRSEWDSY